ncbi:MAG TPA: ABC transporter substrate-binding protein [Roseococcus sp.]|jgi:peptide/nickel transport system substrate-binding protein|nr:ABC transporter substrate-binding protein [Roseococcus sp.]
MMPSLPKRALLTGGGAALAAAALPGAQEAQAQTPRSALVIAAQIDDLVALDPHHSFEVTGSDLLKNVYDQLFVLDPTKDTAELQPGIAESFTVSEDGRTYTFRIRQGVRFHSGNALTAADVVYSLRRPLMINRTPAFMFRSVGLTRDNVEQNVRQTGDFEVQVTFNRAYAPTLIQNLFTANIASVLDSRLVQQNAGDDMGNAWLNRNSAASGAYRLVRYQPNESYTLERNDNWWRGRANLQRVIVRHVPEAATQRLLLERGDVDVARNLTPTDIAALRGRPNISLAEFPRGTIQYFSANVTFPLLSNPKVVEALKYLVDYDGIANNLLPGQVFPHQSFIPRAILGAIDTRPYTYDPDRARRLLTEAGHANGIALTIDTANSFPSLDVAQTLQASMARGGVRLEVLPATGAQVLAKFRARNHQLFIGIWGLGYPDPHYNADSFTSNPPGADNPGKLSWRNGWDIPELTRRTEAAMTERDQNARAAIYRQIQEEFMNTSPFAIFAQQQVQVAHRSNLRGYMASSPGLSAIYWLANKG